jgi:hypothetical protein
MTTAGPFDPSIFFPAMKQAGMTKIARVALPNCPTVTVVDVTLRMLDEDLTTGARSRSYTMDYQRDDLPGLIEGCELSIDGEGLFAVRKAPRISERDSGSGFFRQALLSKTGDNPSDA